MNAKSIKEIHTGKTGKVSDKWESYLDYYDEALAPFRNQVRSMLEIGVQNGGSIETWAEYFTKCERFVGCDIDQNCSKLKYDDTRISIVVGDVNSQTTYNRIKDISPSYDLIIDDGSHVSTDILNAFVNYFPMVSPGGLYIVEDAHCVYMDQFGGGILNDYSAQNFFKRICDLINYQWWKTEVSIPTHFSTFFRNKAVPSFISEGSIDSIYFRNSIISIRKAKTYGHEKLGRRLISGTDASVQTWGGSPPSG